MKNISKSKIVLIILMIFISKNAFSLPRSLPIETETVSSGASSIVFDSSTLDLESENDELKTIFNYDFDDNNIEFLASGYWKSLITTTSNYTFGFGTTPTSTISTPVFAQEVDLSLWFMVNHNWYFEAAFADDFEKKTIAAGYEGNGIVKKARIANRGIIFPDDYSISKINKSIGGSDNEAPGFSINLKNKKWRSDGVIRYDMLKAEEKSWYGKNTITTNEIDLTNWNGGNQFYLPFNDNDIEAIYVESQNGTYKDSKGRKYKKLDDSQYLFYATKKMLLLSKDAKATKKTAIAIKFQTSKNSNELTKLLEETQECFENVDLSKYYFFKENVNKAFGEIEGNEIVYIQYPSGFSPFISTYKYDCGISNATDATISSKSSDIVNKNYTVELSSESFSFTEKDFFYENHTYADIFSTNDDDSNLDFSSPYKRFPFAKTNSQIYLSQSNIQDDLILKVKTYSPVTRYDIGTNAVSGTVKVYKNGILDSNAKYDEESGTIELSSNVGSGDHILATWYEDSQEAESGMFALGLGFEYFFTNNFKSDIALSTQYSFSNSSKKQYASEDFDSPGFVAFALGNNYESENLKVSNTFATTFENINTTDIYRILGMDSQDSGTSYLSKTSGVDLPDDFSPILNIETQTIELENEKNFTIKEETAIKDSSISGYAIPISWDFSDNIENELCWAGKSISLSTQNLSSTTKFEIALKNQTPNKTFSDDEFKIYLQFGVESDETFSNIEERDLVPTVDISSLTNFSLLKTTNEWQILSISFTDEMRSRISTLNQNNLRIIITSNSNTYGTLLVGPYEIYEMTFSINADKNAKIDSYNKVDSKLTSSKIKKFNTSSNYVQTFDWNIQNVNDNYKISMSKYFKQIDASNYSELNFFFNICDTTTSSNSLLSTQDISEYFITFNFSDSTNTAIKIALKYELIKTLSQDYHCVTLNLDSKILQIDGKRISQDLCEIEINREILLSKFEIELNPVFEEDENKQFIEKGTLNIDEIYLSGVNPYFTIQNKTNFSYKKNGDILKINDKSIFKDFSFSATNSLSSTLYTNESKSNESQNSTNGKIGATITNIKIESEILKKSSENTFSSASHKISFEKPIFNAISFNEEYNFNSDEETASKSDSLKISNEICNFNGTAFSSSDTISVNQNVSANIDFKIKKTTFSTELKANQKINTSTNEEEIIKTENYFDSWHDSSKIQFSLGEKSASKRELIGNSKLEQTFDFLKLKPSIEYKISGLYKSTSNANFTDNSSIIFLLPFIAKQNAFTLTWKKTSKESKDLGNDLNENYVDDANTLSNKISSKKWFLTSIPFSDLLSEDLSNTIFRQNENGESDLLQYSSNYDLLWKRQFTATKYDFFIPNMAELSFSRSINAASTLSDFYQIQVKTGNMAINMFGSTGLIPLFKWYQQDEFISSFSFASKIPRKNASNRTYLLNAYLQSTFYFDKSDYLKSGIEGNFEDKYNWSGKSTFIWKRNGKSTLFDGIIKLIKNDFDTKNITHTRTDNLNLSFSKTESGSSNMSGTKKYEIEYSHNLDSKITKYVTINSSLASNYNVTWNSIMTLSLSAGLGCTIQF